MNVGDIFWVEFSARGGRAQAGRGTGHGSSKSLNVAHRITHPANITTRRPSLSGDSSYRARCSNSLRQPSVALVFQLIVVDRNFIKNKLGTISDEKVEEIWAALDELSGRE